MGSRPKLTAGKAALVSMIERYTRVALEASIVEVQKLMYFLQEAGQPLRLAYKVDRYGLYADIFVMCSSAWRVTIFRGMEMGARL